MEYSAERMAQEEARFVVVHASHLAQPHAYTASVCMPVGLPAAPMPTLTLQSMRAGDRDAEDAVYTTSGSLRCDLAKSMT